MSELDRFLENAGTVAVSGHINPDGDCVGSCLAMKAYINANYPEIRVDVLLQKPPAIFAYLKGYDEIITSVDKSRKYDLLILLDISGIDRVVDGKKLVENSSFTVCIDHHKTNEGGFDYFCNEPMSCSACEVLYKKLDPEKITYDCAEALYTGIVHDTGVFRFSNTSPDTMRIAGSLMAFGIPFTDIIDESYFKKNYVQNVMLGEVLVNSKLLFDGMAVIGTVSFEQREALGISTKELDGIVNQLANTRGAEIAAFVYEMDNRIECKASLRSSKKTDVSIICKKFGGGGHEKASGCMIKGKLPEACDAIIKEIGAELEKQGLI